MPVTPSMVAGQGPGAGKGCGFPKGKLGAGFGGSGTVLCPAGHSGSYTNARKPKKISLFYCMLIQKIN